MIKIIKEDLIQTSPSRGVYVASHAYLLKHPNGNILFYNTGDEASFDSIEKEGGFAYQILSHRDESGPNLGKLKKRFDSKLVASEMEVPFIASDVDVVLSDPTSSFSDLHQDVVVLHTPGHTNGSLCVYYNSPVTDLLYLFTGDTLWKNGTSWDTFLFPGVSSRDDLNSSLSKKLRKLNPNLVIGSAFSGSGDGYSELGNIDEWLKIIDSNL
jgi:glyoxylase-like metal-dependent hydrolase (beta-lactamase superfamily II)